MVTRLLGGDLGLCEVRPCDEGGPSVCSGCRFLSEGKGELWLSERWDEVQVLKKGLAAVIVQLSTMVGWKRWLVVK